MPQQRNSEEAMITPDFIDKPEDMINQIVLGDCLETMRRMPDNFVDCIITSPPYNMRTRIRNGEYTTRERSEHFSKKYEHFGDDLSIEDYEATHTKALAEMMRVSSLVFWNIQIVTGSKEAVFKILGKFAEQIRDVVIWDKGSGQPAMHEGVLNRATELIIAFEPDGRKGRTFAKHDFKRGTVQDIWRFGRGGKGLVKAHAAVFPEKLVGFIIQNFTKEDETIYDPFLGTGTVAKVAKDLNRNYIGSEISKEYCDIAEERLRQEALV